MHQSTRVAYLNRSWRYKRVSIKCFNTRVSSGEFLQPWSRIYWSGDMVRLSFMMPCLTDCSQSASELGRQPSQQEVSDQEGRGGAKEEVRFPFMDFAVRDVAEQLTRLDSVGLAKLHLKPSARLLLLHPCRVCLRSSSSEWCPSTAWAASGLSATRKKTASWRPPCAQPSPSSTRWPTASSPPFSAHLLPALPVHRPCLRPTPPPPSCTPPRTWTRLTAAPPSEHAPSRGGSPLLRFGIRIWTFWFEFFCLFVLGEIHLFIFKFDIWYDSLPSLIFCRE